MFRIDNATNRISKLEWRRLDDKKVAMAVAAQGFEGYNKENWRKMIEWLVAHIGRLERIFEPHITPMRQLLRTKFPRADTHEDAT